MGFILTPTQQVSASSVPQTTFRRVMPAEYWHDVSQCESEGNWQDGGYYAGGLGIARSTWVGYGGREFARTPDKATPDEQMIVARRISVTGYQTRDQYRTLDDYLAKRPYFRPPVGFFGWGCIKNNEYLHPWNWWRKHAHEYRRKKVPAPTVLPG